MSKGILRIAHTPDPDDAYMFYGIVSGAVRVEGWDRVEHIVEDIESLNRRLIEQNWEVEMTAASAHAYAYLAGRYFLLRAGASMGEGYGPVLVAKKPLCSIKGARVAVPGRYTTARLLLALATGGGYDEVAARFDQIPGMVLRGEVDAGLLIHEAQLTYRDMGLVEVLNLWDWWSRETGGLPMPLGVDLASRSIGRRTAEALRDALQESIRYAWSHHEEAVRYAARFSHDTDINRVSRFVRMYVNERTLDMGKEGLEAHKTLYRMAAEKGLIPPVPSIDIV